MTNASCQGLSETCLCLHCQGRRQMRRRFGEGLAAWIPETDSNGPFFGVARGMRPPEPVDRYEARMLAYAKLQNDQAQLLGMVPKAHAFRGLSSVTMRVGGPPALPTLRERLASYPRRQLERVGNLLIELGRRLGGWVD